VFYSSFLLFICSNLILQWHAQPYPTGNEGWLFHIECLLKFPSARRVTGNHPDAMGMPMLNGRLGTNCPFRTAIALSERPKPHHTSTVGERSIGGAKDQFNRNYKHCSAASYCCCCCCRSSRVFHVIDSATLQATHRCTPAPYGTLAVPAALPTHSFGDVDHLVIQIFALYVRCRLVL